MRALTHACWHFNIRQFLKMVFWYRNNILGRKFPGGIIMFYKNIFSAETKIKRDNSNNNIVEPYEMSLIKFNVNREHLHPTSIRL